MQQINFGNYISTADIIYILKVTEDWVNTFIRPSFQPVIREMANEDSNALKANNNTIWYQKKAFYDFIIANVEVYKNESAENAVEYVRSNETKIAAPQILIDDIRNENFKFLTLKDIMEEMCFNTYELCYRWVFNNNAYIVKLFGMTYYYVPQNYYLKCEKENSVVREKHILALKNYENNIWRLPLSILEKGFSESIDPKEQIYFMNTLDTMRKKMGAHSNIIIKRLMDRADFVFFSAFWQYGEELFVSEDWPSEPMLLQDWQVNQTEEALRREIAYRKQAQFEAEEMVMMLEKRIERFVKRSCSAIDFPAGWIDLFDKTARKLWFEDSDVIIEEAYLKDGCMIIHALASDPILQDLLNFETETASAESKTICAYCGNVAHDISEKTGYPICNRCASEGIA